MCIRDRNVHGQQQREMNSRPRGWPSSNHVWKTIQIRKRLSGIVSVTVSSETVVCTRVKTGQNCRFLPHFWICSGPNTHLLFSSNTNYACNLVCICVTYQIVGVSQETSVMIFIYHLKHMNRFLFNVTDDYLFFLKRCLSLTLLSGTCIEIYIDPLSLTIFFISSDLLSPRRVTL